MLNMKFYLCVFSIFFTLNSLLAEEVRLINLDPPEAQQAIDKQDQSLHYAPKVDSNVPAVRYLGNEPHDVQEDIYLARQYHGQDGIGGYLYGYNIPDIAKTEKKVAGGDLRGAYNYKALDGQEIKVEYWDDGTGFHQIDNVPKILPKQIDDSPEVKAEKDRFLARWHEEAERNQHPVADPYDSNGNYASGPLSLQGQQDFKKQFSNQYPQGQSGVYQQAGQYQPNTQYSQNTGSYQQQQPGQYQQGGQYKSSQSSSFSQQPGSGAYQKSGQYQPSTQYSSFQQTGSGAYQQSGQYQPSTQYSSTQKPGSGTYQQTGQYQPSTQYSSSQQTGSGAYQQSGQYQPSTQYSSSQKPGSGTYQQSGHYQPSTQYSQSSSSSQQQQPGQYQQGYQYQQGGQSQYGSNKPSEQRGQPNNQIDYTGQYSENQNTYSSYDKPKSNQNNNQYSSYGYNPQNTEGGQSGYSSTNQVDNSGQYDKKYEEENGPPKGFFYSYDYPVGKIVSVGGIARVGDLKSTYDQNKSKYESQLHTGQGNHNGYAYTQ